MTARRDALFLSIRHAPMNKMHPKGTCSGERLSFNIVNKVQKGGDHGLDDTRFG
jgi:hypothetical protein